jgi:hypothetical protein
MLGVVAGITVAGGTSVIASSTTKTVTVCANKKTNVLRYAKNGKCSKAETRIRLNQAGVAGPKGDAGLTGATGPKGDTGPTGPAGVAGVAGVGFSAPLATGANCTGSKCSYQIGDTGPGGGIIFFVDYTNQYPTIDYLEAAPMGWGNGIAVNQVGLTGETTGTSTVDPQMTWCSMHTTLLGLDGWSKSAVGAGKTNTATADQSCFGGAIRAATEYAGAGKTDWFLPSVGEAMLMYANLRQMGLGGFGTDNYWTSSEVDWDKSWGQRSGSGDQNDLEKRFHLFVRPVRSF